MPTGELSVAITGRDDVSPAIRMATQALDRQKTAVKEASVQADLLRDRFQRLRSEQALGLTVGTRYHSQLRTLKADIAELANTTKLGVEQQQLLTQTTRALDTEMRRVSSQTRTVASGLTRTSFAISAFAGSTQGGVAGLQALSSGLLALSVSNPAMAAAIAGLSAIAAIMALLRDTTEQTVGGFDALHGRSLAQLRGVARALEVQAAGRPEEGQLFGGRFRFFNYPATAQRVRQTLAPFLPASDADRANLRLSQLRGVIAGMELEAKRGAPSRSFSTGFGMSAGDLNAAIAAARAGNQSVTVSEAFRGFSEETRRLTAAPLADSLIPQPDSMEKFIDQLKRVGDALKEVRTPAMAFSDALTAGFGAVIDAAAQGQNVIEALTKGVLRSLAAEARAKAVFELAEAFASLFGKGGPAAAAAHFKAAALYGAAAGAAGALAGGGAGGGRGAGGGGRTGSAPGAGTSPQPVIHITQIITETGRVVASTVARLQARDTALGGQPAGVASTTQVRVPGLLVVADGPVTV